MRAERVMRGSKDVGMIRQTEIIVRTKIDYLPRFPGVIDRGSGICRRKKLGLVQFNGPSAELHPVRKARRGLQWVVAFAHQEITQTKFCRISIHRAEDSCSFQTSEQPVFPAKLTISSFTKFSLRVSPLLPQMVEFRVGAAM
jgi:hypothetical protein